MVYGPIREYDELLADIKRQISRMKTVIAPEVVPEFANEIHHHLNQVVADLLESARIPDSDKNW